MNRDEERDIWSNDYEMNVADSDGSGNGTEEPNFTMRESTPENYSNGEGQPQRQSSYNRLNTNHIPQEPDHKEKKNRSNAGKFAGVTAAALLFGVVAGGTMFGVNYMGEQISKKSYPQVGLSETFPAAALPSDEAGMGSAAVQAVPTVMTDVSAIVENAMPSVVAIDSTTLYQSNTWFGAQQYEVPSSGSGIIIGQNDVELLIVTNNHVVQDTKGLKVNFIDSKAVDAVVKGTDSESDLAVIAVPLDQIEADTMSQITVANMGDSNALKVGQGVVAIGNALGYGQSVTVGYVSALNREVHTDESGQNSRTLLQTDAAINPGNSGGALLNMKGEVVGINAAKYSSTEVEGMGYAIPISEAQDIINELMNKKTRTLVDQQKQGYLGIQGTDIDQNSAASYGMPKGIFVFKIVEGGAASKSDLREKDIITKFDGQSVNSMADLKDMLTYYEGGSKIELTVQSLENGAYVERIVPIVLDHRATETSVN